MSFHFPRLQDRLANSWMNEMSDAALRVIRGKRLMPEGNLVTLQFEYGRPNSKENFGQFHVLSCFVLAAVAGAVRQFHLASACMRDVS